MDPRLLARLGGLAITTLLFLSIAQAAEAAPVGGTDVWTMVGTPSIVTNLGKPEGVVAFSNNFGAPVSGIVIMVLRNNASQLVYYSTATLSLQSGQISSAVLIEFGLSPGTYHATFFAFTFGGVAISSPTSALFTTSGVR